MTEATVQALPAPALPKAARTALAGVAIVALAALAGALCARIFAAPPATRVASRGDLRARVPASWRPASTSFVPGAGLAFDAGDGAQALVLVAPMADASLVPADIARLLAHAPARPVLARVAGWRAWRYDGLTMRDGRAMDLAVVPTSRGVLAIACAAPRPARDCASAISSASVAGAVAFVPEADLGRRIQVTGLLGAFDAERVSRRAALATAPTAPAIAQAAGDMAATYSRTAVSLRPLGAAAAPLPDRLEATRDAYRDLSRTALARDRVAYRSAAARIGSGELHLTAAVDHLVAGGTLRAPTIQAALTERRGPAGAGSRLVIALLGGSLAALTLVLVACVRPLRRSRWRWPAATTAPAMPRTTPRRTAGPETSGEPAEARRGRGAMAVVGGLRGVDSCSVVLMRTGATGRFLVLPGTHRSVGSAVAQSEAFPVPRLGPMLPTGPAQRAREELLDWLAREGYAPVEEDAWDDVRLITRTS